MANPTQFAAAVLRGIGAPVTPHNIAGFIGWSKAEGGDNWSRNNPLNTTLVTPGATRTINSAGVKAYTNAQAGVHATVQTLLHGDPSYAGIRQAFRSNNVGALAGAIGNSKWGTSGSLAAQTIRDTLGQHFNVPSGSSGLGGGGMPGGGATGGRGGRGRRFSSTTVPTFNQAGYQNALGRYQAGVAMQAASKMPPLPNATPGFASSLGNPNRVLFQSGALTTTPPNKQGFAGSRTIRTAQNNLQRLAGNTPLNQHPGAFAAGLKGSGYVNPLPGASWESTDMGVDASMRNGAPIRAMTDSRVTDIHTFYKGQPIITFQILNGPQKGRFYYISEAINSRVKKGDVVRAGQTVGTYNINGTGLELGWAGDAAGNTLAQTTTGYKEGEVTRAGKSFRNFLNGLGAGAGPGGAVGTFR